MRWGEGASESSREEQPAKEIDLKQRRLVLALVLIVLVIMTIRVYLRATGPAWAPADVVMADNRDYFPVVHNLFLEARRSIDVILYQSCFYFEYPLSRSNTLIADLVDAQARGVKVRVVLEAAEWNFENSEDNRDVWNLLKQAGVETYFDPLSTTSHSKLVVVDGEYTVMGSMNWSYYALDKNSEATVVIESKKIARQFEEYFGEVVRTGTADYPLPEQFLKAADVPKAKGNAVFIRDLVDSARYDSDRKEGLIYLGAIVVRVDADALEEALAVEPRFFDEIRGDTLRVFGELNRDNRQEVHALDLETARAIQAMAQAFDTERTKLKAVSLPKPPLKWTHADRVMPIPNRAYAPEVERLVKAARERIWIAMLDARYYEKRPVPAEREKKPRPEGAPPSLTNDILAGLEAAARRGVDVRLVVDMGRGGRVPESKLAFLTRLKEAGGKVYEDSPDVTTHAKVFIVDSDFTVVGSTNWSQPAVEDNNETAVMIESPEINGHYADFIDGIVKAGTPFN